MYNWFLQTQFTMKIDNIIRPTKMIWDCMTNNYVFYSKILFKKQNAEILDEFPINRR
jgi:hypothetical protein